MTKDEDEEYFQDTKHRPFCVILVDFKRAAEEEEIHCIETPLDDDDLKFVALSYRWGDLEETMVNTQVGCLAAVTSFDLDDFYQLCRAMTKEINFKNINYVWVDIICVDQANHDRRKATIYQMSNIYERATYILAVPDLHLSYLINSNPKNIETISFTVDNSKYIYHLIHGHTDQLIELDEKWMDSKGVPQDQALRQTLGKYKPHFVDKLIEHNVQNYDYTVNSLAIDGSINPSTPIQQMNEDSISDETLSNSNNHKYNQGDDSIVSQFDLNHNWRHHVREERKKDEWKNLMTGRTENIRQSMEFFESIVFDWSTRVWVISECHIAKEKKNLKYWFIQLQNPLEFDSITFFEFHFDDHFQRTNDDNLIFTNESLHHVLTTKSCSSHKKFETMMQRQLHHQTFLEMILKSKASRNEDRLYAILPLTEYKSIIEDKAMIQSWKIWTLRSLKLKLFEIMSPIDKLELLFLSYKPQTGLILNPTFASTRIKWPTENEYHEPETDFFTCNFDLDDPLTIMLCRVDGGAYPRDEPLYFLNIKPFEYYNCDDSIFAQKIMAKNRFTCETLELDIIEDCFHMVCIPSYSALEVTPNHHHHYRRDLKMRKIFLVGCFEKNIWIISAPPILSSKNALPNWTLHYAETGHHGFNIY